jgi:hypothetical protein
MIPFIEPARISQRQRLMHGYPDVSGRHKRHRAAANCGNISRQIAVRPNKALDL